MEDNKQKLTKAYEDYGDALFRFCFFKISNRDKALDLVQETYTRVWQYMLQDHTIENIKPFLYTTARHLIIDEYRKKKIFSLDILTDLGFDQSIDIKEDLYTSIDTAILMKHIEKLPEQYRDVIIMRYIDDLSVKDIAKAICETENVTSVRLHRGLAKLKLLIPT